MRPSNTAGDGKLNGKDTGEHARYNCTNCGFPCKPGRDALGGEVSRTQTLESATEPAYSETINRGCPVCGSVNWKK